MGHEQSGLPPALTALDPYPLLRASVEASLSQQAERVAERQRMFWGRHTTLAALDAAIESSGGGVVVVEGPPGSGVSAVLAHLAATRRAAFWFMEEDAGAGAAALGAQILALAGVPVPLIPPAINSDPLALEQLLHEVAAHSTSLTDTPLLLLIDPLPPDDQRTQPFPPAIPANLPPHVVVLYGATPGAALPLAPLQRITLPLEGEEVHNDMQHVLHALRCPTEWHRPLLEAAQGHMLYLAVANVLRQQGVLDSSALPMGLDALYDTWWHSLDNQGRQLALLLAAAGEPLPLSLCAALLDTDPLPWIKAWDGLVTRTTQGVLLYHWSSRAYVARQQPEALAQTHADIAARVSALEGPGLQEHLPPGHRAGTLPPGPESAAYLARQFARHAALGTVATRHTLLPLVTQRGWVRQHERSNNMPGAARDAAWELRTIVASSGTELALTRFLARLGRSCALVGTLNLFSRTLSPDVAVAAFEQALEHLGREAALKQVLDRVEQLPDGQGKAQVLRQLGEACYAARMRTSAMRLLSQALDMEEQRLPSSLREQHDHTLVVLVEEALAHGAVDDALAISEHILHKEQRGMAETRVVRFLLAQGELVRARKVASNIAHESLGAWSLAEVVAAVARSGDFYMADVLLNDVKGETARVWAQIELACMVAIPHLEAALSRIEQLEQANQRDQGLARIAHILAEAGQHAAAMDIARRIGDTTVQVPALLELSKVVDEDAALAALQTVRQALEAMADEVRVPLVAMLAASYAGHGQRDLALLAAKQLETGEEHDRALSRVAVALARSGRHSEGLTIARNLPDDDERDWTLGELACVLAERGYWQESQAFAHEIQDEKDKARTLANLAIALARTGAALASLWLARLIQAPCERARALNLIAPLLVQAGHAQEALNVVTTEQQRSEQQDPDALPVAQIHRYRTALGVALAEEGNLEQAQQVAQAIGNPSDQARVHLAMAHYAAHHDPPRAYQALARALSLAVKDRSAAFRLLEQAAPTFALLGGPSQLVTLANAIQDIDSW
jgi:tetratricopeptide (TPR) repeat protein